MQVTTNLKDPFSYSMIPILLCSFLILFFLLYYLMKKPKKEKKIIPPKQEKKDINKLKKQYIQKLNSLLESITKQEISSRIAYQQLSILIRTFVFETIDLNLLSFTLQDIEKMGMPVLTELIKEYYAPEFSLHIQGNIIASIKKTKEVIEKW